MYRLAITIKTNLFVVNFLDIQFNLQDGTFKTYRKPNNEPTYVHKASNYLLKVLIELPKSIGKQTATILSSKEIFESSTVEYENALKISEYNQGLIYQNSPSDKIIRMGKRRKRAIKSINEGQ